MPSDPVDHDLDPVRHVDAGSGRVDYQLLGDPDDGAGAHVVLLPGLTDGMSPVSSPRTRTELAALPFALCGRRAVALSYPDPLPAGASTAQLAHETGEVIEALVSRPVVVVAHSLGGMVAQHLAVDRPDLVERMVLSGTAGRADDRLRTVLSRWDELVRAGRFGELARDGQETARPGPNRPGMGPTEDDVEVPSPARVSRHLALSAACASHDALDRVSAIACPVTVLAADQDVVMHVDLAEELAHAVPGATFDVAVGVGHGLPQQAPRWYAQRVEAALDVAGDVADDR